MIQSETAKNIIPALLEFSKEVPRIRKDAKNPFHDSDYATLDNILETIRPFLSKNDLFIIQNTDGDESGQVIINTRLFHRSGEWLESDGIRLMPKKNAPQDIGSAVTYARRYDLCAFLSLNVGEDDDGNNATGLNPADKKKQQQQPAKRPQQQTKKTSQQKPDQPNQPNKQPDPQPKQQPVALASRGQVNKIHTLASDYVSIRGGEKKDVLHAAQGKTGVVKLKTITLKEASAMIAQLEEWVNAARKTEKRA